MRMVCEFHEVVIPESPTLVHGSFALMTGQGLAPKTCTIPTAYASTVNNWGESVEMEAKKISVLVIDDDRLLLDVMCRYLSRDFKVTAATNAADALKCLESQTFDVMVTDRLMPDMTGNTFATLAKERSPEVPILLISGGSEGADVDVSLFAGFLHKPFTGTELAEAVRDAVAAGRVPSHS